LASEQVHARSNEGSAPWGSFERAIKGERQGMGNSGNQETEEAFEHEARQGSQRIVGMRL
jgi:hypothetical protein